MTSMIRFLLAIFVCYQFADVGFALMNLTSTGTLCSKETLQGKLMDRKHMECFQKYINQEQITMEFQNAIMTNAMPDFMKKNCPKWKEAITCIDDFFATVGECLDPTQRFATKLMKNMIVSSMDYLCYDDGRRILEFMANGGLQCLSENKNSFGHCMVSDDSVRMFNPQDIQQGVMPKIEWSPKLISPKDCQKLFNASDCFLSTVQRLCSNSTRNFLYGFLITLMNDTPCVGILGKLENIEYEHYLMAGLLPKHIVTGEKRKCPTGGTVQELAQRAMTNATVCWKKQIDNLLLVDDAMYAYKSKTMPNFFKKYCPKVRNAAVCVGDFLDSFKSCVPNQEDVATLESSKKVFMKLVEFLCKDDGEKILSFLKDNGVECVVEQLDGIKACMADKNVQFFKQGTKLDVGHALEIIYHDLWAPQQYNAKECGTFFALRVCVSESMAKCKERNVANVTDGLMTALEKETPCMNVAMGTGRAASFALVSPFIIWAFILISTTVSFLR